MTVVSTQTDKRWAVSLYCQSDGELKTEAHYAETWREALLQHSKVDSTENRGWQEGIPNELEQAKQYFIDLHQVIDVIRIH